MRRKPKKPSLKANQKRIAREFIWRNKIVDAFQYTTPKAYEELLDLCRRIWKAANKRRESK